jgi:uncharacterized membrane protein
MDPTPILSAPLMIQLHILAGLAALTLAPVALLRRRRDRWHRRAGRAVVVALLVLAGSSLFIHENPMLGPFSPIHLLTVLTLHGLYQGLAAIRRGDIAAHARAMRALVVQALILAAVLAFLPGRRLNLALFPGAPELGFAGVAALGLGLAILALRLPLPPGDARA